MNRINNESASSKPCNTKANVLGNCGMYEQVLIEK